MDTLNKQSLDLLSIIQRVDERLTNEERAKDLVDAAARRLTVYPIMQKKIEDDLERIMEIEQYGVRDKSKSIALYQRSGTRLMPEEIAEALINDLRVNIASMEQEINTIDNALNVIEGNPYADIIRFKFFNRMNDEEIAFRMNCDPSTVRRNKKHLLRHIAIYLYGVAAAY